MIKLRLRLRVASCNHQKSKLRAVAGAEGFWFAELRVRQLKIGSKSCFGKYSTSKKNIRSIRMLKLTSSTLAKKKQQFIKKLVLTALSSFPSFNLNKLVKKNLEDLLLFYVEIQF